MKEKERTRKRGMMNPSRRVRLLLERFFSQTLLLFYTMLHSLEGVMLH